MKIDRIRAYPFHYSPKEGPYELSGGRRFDGFDSVIVAIDTDEGITGWGEHASSPLYFVSLHTGALAALQYLAPTLIGLDPTKPDVIRAHMDDVLRGHEYAKTAIDIACWDVLGKKAGLPLHALLGGAYRDELPVLHFVKLGTPEEMLEQAHQRWDDGFRSLQIKVGGFWRDDVARIRAVAEHGPAFDTLIVDANAYWTSHEATLVLSQVRDLPFLVEQPCRDLDANRDVRRRFDRPLVLDESLDGLDSLLAAEAVDAFDCAMLKTSRFGGIGAMRRARDLCVMWGRAVTIEDLSGGEIAASVAVHLAASTPEHLLVSGSLTTTYVNESVGEGLVAGNGRATVPQGPGLGITVDEERLGEVLVLA